MKMKELLRADTAFGWLNHKWGKKVSLVLGTLLSGAYIELQPGFNR